MHQPFFLSQPTAALRRLYFVAVDTLDVRTRLISTDIGSFVVYLSKNGATPAVPSGGASVSAVHNTNMPGVFYVQLAAADLDTLGPLVVKITSTGGTKTMEPREYTCEVEAFERYNAVRGTAGTALPNVAAAGAGGLFTRGSGAGQINQNANGQVDVRVVDGAFIAQLTRIEGLLRQNTILDNVSYGDGTMIVSMRMRVFASAAATNAATPGNANNADGEVARYTISAVDLTDGQFSSWKMVRDL